MVTSLNVYDLQLNGHGHKTYRPTEIEMSITFLVVMRVTRDSGFVKR